MDCEGFAVGEGQAADDRGAVAVMRALLLV